MSRTGAALVAVLVLPLLDSGNEARADDARVTIATILASGNHQDVHPKLQQIAAEVKKHEQGLTGYKLVDTEIRPVSVGQKESFKLVGDAVADVTVLGKDEAKKRVRLTVKPPTVGEITYSINYDKFFPIVTRYMVGNERLIIAIMVQPPKEKESASK